MVVVVEVDVDVAVDVDAVVPLLDPAVDAAPDVAPVELDGVEELQATARHRRGQRLFMDSPRQRDDASMTELGGGCIPGEGCFGLLRSVGAKSILSFAMGARQPVVVLFAMVAASCGGTSLPAVPTCYDGGCICSANGCSCSDSNTCDAACDDNCGLSSSDVSGFVTFACGNDCALAVSDGQGVTNISCGNDCTVAISDVPAAVDVSCGTGCDAGCSDSIPCTFEVGPDSYVGCSDSTCDVTCNGACTVNCSDSPCVVHCGSGPCTVKCDQATTSCGNGVTACDQKCP